MRVGDHDRPFCEAGLLHPRGARELAVPIQGAPSGKDRVILFAARQDRCDARPHRPLSDHQLSLAGDQRGVADLHALHIGDGIELSRSAFERDAEVARPGPALGGLARFAAAARQDDHRCTDH